MANRQSRRTRRTARSALPYALVGRDAPVLRQVAAPVEFITPEVKRVAARMALTLQRNPIGMALAAPQVGVSLQIVVTRAGKAYANPRVEADVESKLVAGPEGCLSLPGRWYDVERYDHVVVKAIDMINGHIVKLETTGDTARMWQHEDDHLKGLLLVGRYPEVTNEQRTREQRT